MLQISTDLFVLAALGVYAQVDDHADQSGQSEEADDAEEYELGIIAAVIAAVVGARAGGRRRRGPRQDRYRQGHS